jgi:hypothetical protein
MQEYCITQSSFNMFAVLRKRTAGQSKKHLSILDVLRTMLTNGCRSTEQWVALLGTGGRRSRLRSSRPPVCLSKSSSEAPISVREPKSCSTSPDNSHSYESFLAVHFCMLYIPSLSPCFSSLASSSLFAYMIVLDPRKGAKCRWIFSSEPLRHDFLLLANLV